MNKWEIKEALEIIRKPITVNCKDYYYFDQENYNNLISAYENCQWFINNFEQLMVNIEDLQQKVNQLETNVDEAIEHIKTHQFIYVSQYEEMSNFDNHLLEILERGKE